jgi:YhhN family
MRKFIQLVYCVLIVILSILLYDRMFDMANYCRIALSVVLFAYWWLFKGYTKRNIVLWLTTAVFFSIIPFIFLSPYKFDPNNIFVVFFLIVHFCYIQVFKAEKANIFLKKVSFKSFLLLIIVAYVALSLINNRLTGFIFYVYIVFAFQKLVMIWLAFNRNLSHKSYRLNVWAMIYFLLSDAFYVLNVFIISKTWDTPLELGVNIFYLFGQFLLFESTINHHAKQALEDLPQLI